MLTTALIGVFWVAFKSINGHFPIHASFTETYASMLAAFISMMVFNAVFKDRKEPGVNR